MSIELINFSKVFLANLEKSNKEKQGNSPFALILCSSHDPNRAFSSAPTQSLILQIAKTHLMAIQAIQDVSSFKVSLAKYQEAALKPSLLILMGHGFPDKIFLGDGTDPSHTLQEKNLEESDFNALDPQGIIFLHSCSTGERLAQKIADVANRSVFAPREILYDLSTCLVRNEKKEITVATYNSQNKQHMYLFRQQRTPILATLAAIDDRDNASFFQEMTMFLQEAANEGDADAQCKIGILYERGLYGFPQSDKEAANWFCRSSNNGLAQLHLGYFSLSGRGGLPQSEEDATCYFRFAADQNLAEGQYNLGMFYLNGRGGLNQSYKQAAHYFSLAAQQNFPEALYNLGVLFEFGKGVPHSLENAKSLYESAKNCGITAAEERLVVCRQSAFNTAKKINKTGIESFNYLPSQIDICNSSKDSNCPVALILKGKYDVNRALNSSPTEALILQIAKNYRVVLKTINDARNFGKSIRDASLVAGKNLSLLVVMSHGRSNDFQFDNDVPWYRFMCRKEPRYQKRNILPKDFSPLDPEARIILYSCSAGQGIAQDICDASQRTVFATKELICDGSTCLQNWPNSDFRMLSYNQNNRQHMLMFTPNYPPVSASTADMLSVENEESFYNMACYLRKKAAEGSSDAQLKLGGFYLLGKGRCANSTKDAAYWLSFAAENGDAEAQFIMGFLHLSGQGIEQSDHKARYWFQRSADQEFPPALVQLGSFYLNGQCGFSSSDQQAAKLFEIAVRKGNPLASFHLGFMYEHGRGVRRSLKYAIERYKIADQFGIPEANARLANLLLEDEHQRSKGLLFRLRGLAFELFHSIIQYRYKAYSFFSIHKDKFRTQYSNTKSTE